MELEPLALNVQVVGRKTIKMTDYLRIIRLLRKHFEGRLQRKTGWGRNEVLSEYDRAGTEALAEMLNDKSQRETSSDQAGPREPPA